MGRSGEFYTFEEAHERFGITEADLKRRVAACTLKQFRAKGDVPIFRRSDIEKIAWDNDDRASISHRDTTVDTEDGTEGRDDVAETFVAADVIIGEDNDD